MLKNLDIGKINLTIYAFDIDGTICSNTYGDYHNAKPYKIRINHINKLYESGHTIKMFTARGSGTGKDLNEFTKIQLSNWGLKYHVLITGKPEADIFIDDKAINQIDFDWEDFLDMDDKNNVDTHKYFKKVSDAFLNLSFDQENMRKIKDLGLEIGKVLHNDGKVIFAGNGGSFADSQHLAAEFVSKLNVNRKPLAAIALGTNSSSLSAIGNDYGFKYIFARELEAIYTKNDILIAISTSGNSQNIIELLKKSKLLGIKNAILTGPNTNKVLENITNYIINTPIGFEATADIQHLHISIGHLICEIAQQDFI